MQLNTATPTLNEVKQSFEGWRSQRGKMGPFPDEMWRAAVNLQVQYSDLEIIRELRITRQQFEERKQRYALPEPEATSGFVSLAVDNSHVSESSTQNEATPVTAVSTQTTAIEIRRADGSMLSILDFPCKDISPLVSTFIG